MLYSSKFRCGIMPLCLFCALSMVFLSLSRIGLMLWLNSNVPDGSVLYILMQGLRVDFASVCGLYGPAFLILIFCSIVRLKNNAVILIIKIYLALGFTFLVFNEAATPPFILEYGVRPNHLYVQYLIYPKEVLNTLWNGHKLAVFADIFIIALSLYAGFKLASLLFKNYVFASFKITLLSFIAVIIILPLGVRSTLGHRPLNPALISFCNDPLANSLPLNSSYSAVYALAHLNQGKLSASDIYSFDNKENILFEGMDFSVKKNTAHHSAQCPLNQIITSNSPQKYNVVIVLEESLGADFVKSLGGLPLTPNLEQLKNEGWWFTNLYAAGHRSIRGIEAVTASFPPSPLDSIVKLPRTESSYATLSRIYESYGYKTSFIYGGESHFDNMRNYFLENGMQEVIDVMEKAKADLDANGGLKQVIFVACGGSKAAIFPGLYLLQSEAKTFSATTYTSNEFVHATPKQLDGRCVAVICSLKATAETVEAVKVANAAGAITIAMTGSMTTGMAQVGQYVVTYSNGDDQVYSDSNQANSLRIGFELLHQIENWANYDKAMEAYSHIDEIVAEGKKECLPAAQAWAAKEKDEPVFYVLASGPSWRCSGSTPSACTPASTSTAPSRPPTSPCPWSCS